MKKNRKVCEGQRIFIELRNKKRVKSGLVERKLEYDRELKGNVQELVQRNSIESDQRILEMLCVHSNIMVDASCYFPLIFAILEDCDIVNTFSCLLFLRQCWDIRWDAKIFFPAFLKIWERQKSAKIFVLDVLLKFSSDQCLSLYSSKLWLSILACNNFTSKSFQLTWLNFLSHSLPHLPKDCIPLLLHKQIPNTLKHFASSPIKKIASLSSSCFSILNN